MVKNNTKNILLVEDEPTIANLIERALNKEGYKVSTADDGDEGLKAIQNGTFDLVLLDIMLPGKNGFGVMEELKKDGVLPGLPVVVISNSGESVEIQRALDLGVRDYLVKVNFEPEEVVEKVKNVFGQAGKADKSSGKDSAKSKNKNTSGGAEGNHVLIIEDDQLLSSMLARAFDGRDVQSVVASSAAQARAHLNTRASDVACILLDILLPDMDGFEFLKEAKKKKDWVDIPVFIISNLGQKEDVEKGKALGAADYFVKATTLPSTISEKIIARIDKL